MVVLCRKIKAPLQVLEVEAKAYETGMLLARHLGLRDGVLEGDPLTISNALKGILVPPTSVAAIMEGIHVLGSEDFKEDLPTLKNINKIHFFKR